MPSTSKRSNLKSLTTFGIEAWCDQMVTLENEAEIVPLVLSDTFRENKHLILGGGSNILFTKDFHGLVVLNRLKGVQVVADHGDEVVVRASAGENWHGFVKWCLEKGLGGLENLSLIPGCVGASPMQNIGAYGVEIKDVFVELEAYDLSDGRKKIFTREECEFGYRESVFKRKYKDRYLITSVSYLLKRNSETNTSYGAIKDELKKMGVSEPGIKDVSNAVITIRQSKLPDPAKVGNAGSFFKNPEVSAEKHDELRREFPELVAYALEQGTYKLAAGWLIEQCGMKGYVHGGAAVHDKQALVLVNKKNATGKEVFDLSEMILNKVHQRYGVMLEREVNII